jgi:hypothetical protein
MSRREAQYRKAVPAYEKEERRPSRRDGAARAEEQPTPRAARARRLRATTRQR